MSEHPPTELSERDTPLDRPTMPPLRTLPPEHRYVREVMHGIVDGLAIAALVVLVVVKDLDTTLAVTLITIIAGASIGGQLRKNGNGPHSVIIGLATLGWDLVKRVKT